MRTKIIIILAVFSVNYLFAQTDSLSLNNKMDSLSEKVFLLENEYKTILSENSKSSLVYQSLKISHSYLEKKHNRLNRSFSNYKQHSEEQIDSLQHVINSNTREIKIKSDNLGVEVGNTHEYIKKSVIDLNKTISQNVLYWIIAILVIALFVLLAFILLRKQIFKQKDNLTSLDENLHDTIRQLEEEGVKLDNKLLKILQEQLKIINSSNVTPDEKQDHSLSLKVADEIIRIKKNLARMDEKTKGLKQLAASVKRIQDNFASNGYEIVDMLGKPFNLGMNVSANFVPDDDLEEGQQIISRIIKPQVNYKGIMIQSAQIEVSQG